MELVEEVKEGLEAHKKNKEMQERGGKIRSRL